jgi:hypothetical protein
MAFPILAGLVVFACDIGQPKGEEVAKQDVAGLDTPVEVSFDVQRGDGIEIREDFATGHRDDGRSVSRYSQSRCYRWHLTLTEGERSQTKECWALRAIYCSRHDKAAYESGTNCGLEECVMRATADGTATLRAEVKMEANCPIAITEHTLRVRRYRD